MDCLPKKTKKKKKKIVKEKIQHGKTCKIKGTYITNTDKDCDLLQERPILPSGKMPRDNNTASVLINYSQNLVMSPRGAQCQDGRTD